MSCGVGCRLISDPALLWLCCRPAATALIRPLAWEPPYATGATLKKKKEKKILKIYTFLRYLLLYLIAINQSSHVISLVPSRDFWLYSTWENVLSSSVKHRHFQRAECKLLILRMSHVRYFVFVCFVLFLLYLFTL